MNSNEKFIFELDDIEVLIERLARTIGTREQLVEKDFWIMHCLWGLQKQGFNFELKGGTSLSKGFGVISRFSEDIDIRIEPPKRLEVKVGQNHDKPNHIKSRLNFYDWLTKEISIPGITVKRDTSFDDSKARNGGIQLVYNSFYPSVEGVKPYILLEVGFAETAPNKKVTISSWMYDEVSKLGTSVIDNRAKNVKCYLPEYTFVEKLSAISGKFRQEQEGKIMPINFIRHYYDIYQLLSLKEVEDFIGTERYKALKSSRFKKGDEENLSKNGAFILSDEGTRKRYEEQYTRTKDLYYKDFPDFDEILKRIENLIEKL